MSTSKPGSAGGTCPICSRASDTPYRPFCSRRCADVDLARWLSGAYAIPDKVESEDGEAAEPPPAGPTDPAHPRRH